MSLGSNSWLPESCVLPEKFCHRVWLQMKVRGLSQTASPGVSLLWGFRLAPPDCVGYLISRLSGVAQFWLVGILVLHIYGCTPTSVFKQI